MRRVSHIKRMIVLLIICVSISLFVLSNLQTPADYVEPNSSGDLTIARDYRFINNIKSRRSPLDMDSDTITTTFTPNMQTTERRVINPFEFSYVINEPRLCQDTEPYILIYVHSATQNIKQRIAIRSTWGSKAGLETLNAKLIFFLGISEDANTMGKIRLESERYGDVVQENYKDAYTNLTLKAVSALKWVHKHCQTVKFLLKVDDDVLVNVWLVRDFLSNISSTFPHSGVVFCNVWTRMKVMRDPRSKWYLSREEFPDDYFPPYCSGSAFIFSKQVAQGLYSASFGTPFFWVDDYYLTGILVRKAGFRHAKINSRYLFNPNKVTSDFLHGKGVSTLFSHVHGVTTMRLLWRTLELQLNTSTTQFPEFYWNLKSIT